MSLRANKSDRSKVTGYCRVYNLKHTFYLPMEKFDKNLEHLLIEEK